MQTITSEELLLLEAYTPVRLHLYVGGAEVPAKMGSYSQTNAVGGEELSCGAAIAGSIQLGVDAEPIYRILTTRAGEIITDRDGKAFAARLLWRGVYGQEIAITWDVDGETENPLFTGRVEKVTVSAGKATIRAQDALFWSGAEIFRGRETYQADADAGTVFAAIAGEMGVTVDADTASLLSGVTISGGFSSVQDDITLAEAAGYVAGIFGGNALITRAGTLAVIRYTLRDYTAEVYAGGAEAENQNYKLAGLRFSRTYTTRTVNADGTTSLSDRIVSYKAGNGALELDNPLASQAAATRAYQALSAVTVRKGRYSYPLGLIVEPGDVISIVTMDGTYRAAVSSHTLEIDGGVKSTDLGAGALDPDGTSGAAAEEESTRLRARMTRSLLAAAAEEETDEETAEEAPVTPGRKPRISRKLEELELRLLRVENLYAENAQITNANIQSLKAGNIDVDALFARDITATGVFQVRNTAYSLIQSNEGLRLGPDAGEEAPFAYMELTNNHVVIGSRNGIDISADMTLKLFGSYGIELGSNTFPASFYDSFPDFGRTDRRWGTVYCKTVDIDGKPAIARQTKTVTGTTSSAGNLSLGLDMSLYGVLCVTRTGASSICTPYATAGGAWYAHVASNAATPAAVASTSVTLEVDYYAK